MRIPMTHNQHLNTHHHSMIFLTIFGFMGIITILVAQKKP